MNKHLLNAETQIAAELANLVIRFRKAKKNRLELARKILVKAKELGQAAELIHSQEDGPKPVPALPSYLERGNALDRLEAASSKPTIVDGRSDALARLDQVVLKGKLISGPAAVESGSLKNLQFEKGTHPMDWHFVLVGDRVKSGDYTYYEKEKRYVPIPPEHHTSEVALSGTIIRKSDNTQPKHRELY